MSLQNLKERIRLLEEELAILKGGGGTALPEGSSLQELLGASPLGVSLFRDSDQVVTYANARFADVLGYASPDDLLGRTTQAHWRDSEQLQRFVTECAASGRVSAREVALKTVAGKTIWALVSWSHAVLDQQAQTLFWLQDISGQRSAEKEIQVLNQGLDQIIKERTEQILVTGKRVHAAFDEGPIGMELNTIEGVRLRVNHALANFLGYSIEELAGTNIFDTTADKADLERSRKLRRKVIEGAANRYENQLRFRHRDGHTIFGETTNILVRKKNGEPDYFISHIVDVTDRKRTELQLLEAKEAAEEASKVKSEFLASMSHELRTPLNAVLGFAQMLLFDPQVPLQSRQREKVEHILAGGNHLLELINDILDLARLEADKTSLLWEEANANEVVADCVAMTRALGRSKNITVIDRLGDGPSVQLRTDKLRLKQVLLNLLSNAVKYNKQDGLITIVGAKAGPGFFRISVTDTGIGIAEKDQLNIFKMFHRLDADPMVASQGTGIGLNVTKRLVEKMAGRSGLTSVEGEGSTFWIELPLVSNEDVLIWTNNLRVGVDAIDKDHQHLISLLNQVTFHSAEDMEVREAVGDLIDFTRQHFDREELIMEVCNSPDLKDHRALHQQLMAEVEELVARWHKSNSPDSFHHLRRRLRNWLLDHIGKIDTEIAHYAKNKDLLIRKALNRMGWFSPSG